MRLTPLMIFLSLFASLLPGMSAHADGDMPTTVSVKMGADPVTAQYGFGDLSQVGGPGIAHEFVFRNDGPAPLTIARFQPSCHCTTASVLPNMDLPVTVQPGAQVTIRVSVVVEPYLTGPLAKNVEVFASGQDDPLATLAVTATLHPLVVMNPLALDFGSGPAGQARSVTVTATVDDRLAPSGANPTLTATDPDIQITPLPTSGLPDSPGARNYAYRITLAANASLGPINDLLQFARTPNAPAVEGMALADGAGIPVTGTVVGAAAVTPSALAFGIVTQGRSRLMPIQLRARPGLLNTAQVTSESPFLHAAWGVGASDTRTLNVVLDGKAPTGAIQSLLTITLANGQRLRLPVSAYVSAT